MTDVEGGMYSLSEIKGQLDAALIKLETRCGLAHADPELAAAREAGDRLFSGALHRKFTTLAGISRPGHQDILRRRAEEGARDPGPFPR